MFAHGNRTLCCQCGFAISSLIENIAFKPSLGNNSPAIKNYTKLLYFELLMLNHTGLVCGSKAEHLATMNKALGSNPSPIKPVTRCGDLGVVVQICNLITQSMLRLGSESTVTKFEASLGYKKIVFSCANIHSFTS